MTIPPHQHHTDSTDPVTPSRAATAVDGLDVAVFVVRLALVVAATVLLVVADARRRQ